MKKSMHTFCFFFVIALAGCNKNDDLNSLAVSPNMVSFTADGGSKTFTINTDADSWSISNPVSDWLTVSELNGTNNPATITLSISSKTLEPRSGTLVVTAGTAKAIEVNVTQPSSDFLYTLSTDLTTLSFDKEGGSKSLTITTDAIQWSISAEAEWLEFSKDNGEKGSTTISVTASENTNDDPRTATISISAVDGPTIQVSVTQKVSLYPSYNTSPLAADETGMTSSAAELAAKISLGWNIGNTMEAIGGETAWGNPKISEALINAVKQGGFNAVRIPCSWNQYMENSATAKLKTDWLNRVKEVVQYCVDNDVYVLLNIHWDGGWLENNCTPAKQDENNAKQKAFWEQIATHLRDFDEHLLFASANEPNVENATQMAVLKSYHQTFIDAVRSTGGKNSYRVLVIQGPSTDIEKTNNLMTSLPNDEIANRLMVEIHYYTPWNFCGLTEDADWGKMFYYWGKDYHSATDVTRNPTWGEEETVDANFKLMKDKFVDNGIPVVLGEYAPVRRSSLTGDALTLHLASRAYYLKYVTKQAKANGILPFYWDNGGTGNNGSGIFNRNTNTVSDQQALDALVQGATE